MKKHKLSIIGFGLMLFIASCKKNDVEHKGGLFSEPLAKAKAAAVAPEWRSFTNWTSKKAEKFTSYVSAVADSSITSAVTRSGLVLAFAKNGTDIKALPFQDKTGGDAYWYYQVSNGAISFSVDAYSDLSTLNSAGFKYFVFTPEKLKELDSRGHSKINLMQLAYEDVVGLLKK